MCFNISSYFLRDVIQKENPRKNIGMLLLLLLDSLQKTLGP
jgi:hypothetical protein